MLFSYSEIIHILEKFRGIQYSNKEFTIIAFSNLVEKHKVGVSMTNPAGVKFDSRNRISEMCSQNIFPKILLFEGEKTDSYNIILEGFNNYKNLDQILDLTKKNQIAKELKTLVLNSSNVFISDKNKFREINDLRSLLALSVFYSLKYGLIQHNGNLMHSKELKSSDKSIILEIISKIISVKSTKDYNFSNPFRPYNVEEKAFLNNLDDNLTERIKETLDDNFEIIMEVFEEMITLSPTIIQDVGTFYRDTYLTILSEKGISFKDKESIKKKSSELYMALNNRVFIEAQLDTVTSIGPEQLKIYLLSLTAVIFYKCKFLIPIGKEDK